MKWLSLDTVIDSYINLTGHKGILDRVALKQFAEFTLKELSVPEMLVEGISYIKLGEDRRAKLPDYKKIIQLAFFDDSNLKIRRSEVIEWVDSAYDGSGSNIVISKECPRCDSLRTECQCDGESIIFNADEIWRNANVANNYKHMKHYYGSVGFGNDTSGPVLSGIDRRFQLMRPSTHQFFNADQYIPGCLNLNKRFLSDRNRVEYKIRGDEIEVNRDKGWVLFSFMKEKKDEDGYRMIPDRQEIFDAIKWGALKSMYFRKWNKATTGADRSHYKQLYAESKREYNDAFGRASEIIRTPSYKKFMSFLEQNWLRMVKDPMEHQNYYGVKSEDVYNENMRRLSDK